MSANQRDVVWAGEARAHTHPVLCDAGPCSFPSSLPSAHTCAAPLLTRPLSWWQNQSTGAIRQALQMTALLQIQLSAVRFFKIKWKCCLICTAGFQTMGGSKSVTIQRRNLQSPKRKQKSDNNCREGVNNSLMRKSEQINKQLFLFLTVWG